MYYNPLSALSSCHKIEVNSKEEASVLLETGRKQRSSTILHRQASHFSVFHICYASCPGHFLLPCVHWNLIILQGATIKRETSALNPDWTLAGLHWDSVSSSSSTRPDIEYSSFSPDVPHMAWTCRGTLLQVMRSNHVIIFKQTRWSLSERLLICDY